VDRSDIRNLARVVSALACLLASAGPGGADAPPPDPAPADSAVAPGPALGPPTARIRTRGDRFELLRDGVAVPFTIRGVNLGAGAPGFFPGEFGFTVEDYRRYLRFARDLHANAVRVYTLHPPDFYQALREENLAHPDRPLWLFQGVWTELPESNDLWDEPFTRDFEREIGLVMDAVHGAAELAPRPGHAAGRYTADVSPWLAGWLLGREWEPFAVRETERRHPGAHSYRGVSFEVGEGSAMEVWLARVCDFVVERERARYGLAHAVSFVSWPTLDVMSHPTESEPGGREAEHDEDAYAVDPTRIRPTREPGIESGYLGFYATYHVYPYYPDFLNLDPTYSAHRDRHGACNYAGYLADLKAHTPGLPLLVGEYGVPTSRGISHLQPQGLHHGGASDREQGAQIARLLEDIEEAGCAGSLLFALVDEWFKTNWLLGRTERPRDRDPLWHNLLDPEEGFGLIAFDPPARIRVDGAVADWQGIEPYARAPRRGRATAAPAPPPMARALYVTSDATRLYLRLDVDPAGLRGRTPTFGIALDVLDPRRGDMRLPFPLDATWSRGAEFVLIVEPGRRSGNPAPRASLFADRAMNWSEFGRLREGAGLVLHPAPLRPTANEDGLYAPLIVNTNRERISRDGRVYPGHDLDWGRLAHGRDARGPRGAPDDSIRDDPPGAEWWLDRERGVIEIALPWGLLNVGDPSRHAVLDDRPETDEVETTATRGIGLLVWATRAAGVRADSLGPTREGARPARRAETRFLGPPGTRQHVVGTQVVVTSPDSISYLWNGWERPITVERVKRSAEIVRAAFKEMGSREPQTTREFNAFQHDAAVQTRPREPARRRRPHRPGGRARRPGAGSRVPVPGPR
jgi:hypothetical protein